MKAETLERSNSLNMYGIAWWATSHLRDYKVNSVEYISLLTGYYSKCHLHRAMEFVDFCIWLFGFYTATKVGRMEATLLWEERKKT